MLKQIELPTSEARTPAEKMNAVKQSLAKIESLVNGYNELVPIINATFEACREYQEKPPEVIENITHYDDSKLIQLVNAQNRTIESLVSRIEAVSFDDIGNQIQLALDRAEQAEKTADYIRRSYSEKWENHKFERAKFEKEIIDKSDSIKIPEAKPCKCFNYDDSERVARVGRLEEQEGYDDSEILSYIDEIKSEVKQCCYDDSELTKRVSNLESKPDAVDFDDSGLKKDISALTVEVNKKLNASDYFDASDLARELNKLSKKVSLIKQPKPYNDRKIKNEIESVKKSLNEMQVTINSIFD